MAEQVEISSFDLRYEGCRMKSAGSEKALLLSILEKGIVDPLYGINAKESRILLDGFKRYRCAKKLGIAIVPYCSLGSDEAFGIIELIRMANAKSLSILEQAKFIDELKSVHKMSVSEIAGLIDKSKGWVGMRVGIIGQMSPCVTNKIFSGQFPVYAYMYTLRPFIRMNGINKKEVDLFVSSVAGKNLSIRDIEILAHGYFKGTDELRSQIRNGNISWGLSRLKETFSDAGDCTEIERKMLRDLEVTQKYMQRLTFKCNDKRFKTNTFYAQANLLSGGIIRQLNPFTQAIRQFHDQTG
ncbi:MAG: chromosome partitioning protein ParB [Deltaproteobacteria bacterium]|nr:MAG: chromosome partitioning protein ParB [Desulfobacteraceae bacterium 4484_190.3]RLB80856.1 MAG: chromosome partitioning protein ParB [Deltaproteobacteria bacterium]